MWNYGLFKLRTSVINAAIKMIVRVINLCSEEKTNNLLRYFFTLAVTLNDFVCFTIVPDYKQPINSYGNFKEKIVIQISRQYLPCIFLIN